MKQIEIEQMFSKNAMRTQFKSELKEFMSLIGKEHYIELHKAMDNSTDKQFTVDVMIDLIATLGNPKLGVRFKSYRQVEIHHLVSIIAGMNTITNRYDTIYRFKVACEIVEQMDTILFDIVQSKRNDVELGWLTETNAKIEFNVGLNALKLDGLNRYKYPFIEKPLEWHNDEDGKSIGGYHLEELRENVTTNRGSNKQPQQCLDVLNILQSNVFNIRDIDVQEEYDYAYSQMEKKANTKEQIKDLPKNVDTRMLTAYETYTFVCDKDFYLQWRFDFRGRMYSSGYDVNLQSDKFKKGSIKPKMLPDSRRIELKIQLKELEENEYYYEFIDSSLKWVKTNFKMTEKKAKYHFREIYTSEYRKIN